MSFIPHTDSDRKQMLATIGISDLREMFDDVPEALRFPELSLPKAISELEATSSLNNLSRSNLSVDQMPCFLGAGAYRHFIPSTVQEVLRRGEFYTSYTPYQPEASQGVLQAMFEYQSMICRLFEMDVSNASHYDGSTALAEAVLLALGVGGKERNKIVLSPNLNPRFIEVVKTYLSGHAVQIDSSLPIFSTAKRVAKKADNQTAAVVIQSPNFFGQFEKLEKVADIVHRAGALLIVVPDPISLGLFKAPGAYGADLVAAEGQSMGIALSGGGPHLGIFALTKSLMRKSVGRLVGETVDSEGKRGYVLTLSTREQHIRRDKATSNICTNSALTALASAVYMSTLGKNGLKHVANLCYQGSHYAADQIAKLPGFSINEDNPAAPFFKEFIVSLPCPAQDAVNYLLETHHIMGGYDLAQSYPKMKNQMLVATTETNTREEIDRLVKALAELGKIA